MYREKLAMMKNTYRTIYGAIAGDIIGSMYEFRSVKSKDFELFPYGVCFTDDTVMTLAIARWLMEDVTRSEYTLVDTMCEFGNRYPAVGYGGLFCNWLCNDPTPYNSWGNGSAMRVSAVGLVAKTLDECLRLAKQTAAVSHNHPEAIKGAQAVAASIFIALHWTGEIDELKVHIRDFVTNQFEYNMNRTLNEIRPRYEFDVSCQGSVPEAIIAFLEADSYEDAIRNAVSLGGDADTQGAIAGAIAACVYPIPEYIIKECQKRLSDDLLKVVIRFEDYLDNEWQNKISLPCSCLQPKRETVEPEKYVMASRISGTDAKSVSAIQNGSSPSFCPNAYCLFHLMLVVPLRSIALSKSYITTYPFFTGIGGSHSCYVYDKFTWRYRLLMSCIITSYMWLCNCLPLFFCKISPVFRFCTNIIWLFCALLRIYLVIIYYMCSC